MRRSEGRRREPGGGMGDEKRDEVRGLVTLFRTPIVCETITPPFLN